MTARKERLLQRLDTMTHPLLIGAIMRETPVEEISADSLSQEDQDRLAAYENGDLAKGPVYDEVSHIGADGVVDMVRK